MTQPATRDWNQDSSLSETWKFRFRFFDAHGVPSFLRGMGATAELKAAFRMLSFGERMTLNINWHAFFFGFLYFAFALRLWRQALVLIALQLVLGIFASALHLPDGAMTGFGVGYMWLVAMRANALYYLSRSGRDIGWSL
ncbi:MAG: DUF2628 domain-containing protein [Alphaproteobacteria bacterium]|nr:DUF2628 domain-containing protein [Alphaproteobacteria bacterium]